MANQRGQHHRKRPRQPGDAPQRPGAVLKVIIVYFPQSYIIWGM